MSQAPSNPSIAEVKPGMPVGPTLVALKAAAAAVRIQRSTGTLISSRPGGTLIGGGGGAGRGWAHPFRVFLLGGDRVQVTRGLVNEFEPRIGKLPISGDSKNPPPALPVKSADINLETGESWVCLEVTPLENGLLDATCKMEVVHRNAPYSTNPAIGRQPLAMLLWQDGAARLAFPITYFNLRYVQRIAAPGEGQNRHFFL